MLNCGEWQFGDGLPDSGQRVTVEKRNKEKSKERIKRTERVKVKKRSERNRKSAQDYPE